MHEPISHANHIPVTMSQGCSSPSFPLQFVGVLSVFAVADGRLQVCDRKTPSTSHNQVLKAQDKDAGCVQPKCESVDKQSTL